MFCRANINKSAAVQSLKHNRDEHKCLSIAKKRLCQSHVLSCLADKALRSSQTCGALKFGEGTVALHMPLTAARTPSRKPFVRFIHEMAVCHLFGPPMYSAFTPM